MTLSTNVAQNEPYILVNLELSVIYGYTLIMLSLFIFIFTHVKLCLATAIHNFTWVKITRICSIWDQTFAILYD